MVIPARLAAVRLPRKPLLDLAGKPLIVRVWERVAGMGVGHDCVVATDSADIETIVARAGGNVVLTSDSHPSGTDRVAEVADMPRFRDFDNIVNVQGDEPFMGASAVRGAAEMVSGGRFPLGTAAVRGTAATFESPAVVKAIAADDGRAMYFSRAGIPFARDSADAGLRASLALHHLGVYAYSREALRRWVALPPHPLETTEKLEQLRPLAAGIPMGIAVVDDPPSSGIDTEEDLIRANERWANFMGGKE